MNLQWLNQQLSTSTSLCGTAKAIVNIGGRHQSSVKAWFLSCISAVVDYYYYFLRFYVQTCFITFHNFLTWSIKFEVVISINWSHRSIRNPPNPSNQPWPGDYILVISPCFFLQIMRKPNKLSYTSQCSYFIFRLQLLMLCHWFLLLPSITD